MPIPQFESNGWLPKNPHTRNIYEATLDEIEDLCGQPYGCNRRIVYMENLIKYTNEVKKCSNIKYLIINGSFVSTKPKPSDIDILLVVEKKFDLESGEFLLWECNLAERNIVLKQFRKIEVFQALEDSPEYENMISSWSIDQETGVEKGMLKLKL